jgi:hypothetical protein
MRLYNLFLSNASVNMITTIGVLLEMVLSIRFVQSGYKEEFRWESSVNPGVPSEQLVESWGLQGRLKR